MKMVILPGIAQTRVDIKIIQTECELNLESDCLTKPVILAPIFEYLKIQRLLNNIYLFM
jgi:hypothetical protein